MSDAEYEDYRLAAWLHAEGHDEVGSDPELCDDIDCPYRVDAHDANGGQ